MANTYGPVYDKISPEKIGYAAQQPPAEDSPLGRALERLNDHLSTLHAELDRLTHRLRPVSFDAADLLTGTSAQPDKAMPRAVNSQFGYAVENAADRTDEAVQRLRAAIQQLAI